MKQGGIDLDKFKLRYEELPDWSKIKKDKIKNRSNVVLDRDFFARLAYTYLPLGLIILALGVRADIKAIRRTLEKGFYVYIKFDIKLLVKLPKKASQ